MQNLRFHPLLKTALWGGTRLGTTLRKPVGDLPQVAESWDVSDLPRDVSIVSHGALQGISLRELMERHSAALLGRQAGSGQFPLLIKFLDAQAQLSVQVHPQRPTQLANGQKVWGKAEAWVVLDAAPDSRMYVGLKPGVTERDLMRSLDERRVADLLHIHTPRAGDCLLLDPGTVHALGGGILVAEVQLPSDITYRLYDWDRVDSQGRPRQLHREEALASVNYQRGPVLPLTPRPVPGSPGAERLVDGPWFMVDRYSAAGDTCLADDDRMHVLVQLSGSARLGDDLLLPGDVIVLPAQREPQMLLRDQHCITLDCRMPDSVEG